jgi:hypothetical protein
MDNIAHNASDEVKAAVKSGEMAIHTANELAKLGEIEQEEILDEIPAREITPKKVKKAAEDKVTTSSNFSDTGNEELGDDDITAKVTTSSNFSDADEDFEQDGTEDDDEYPDETEPPDDVTLYVNTPQNLPKNVTAIPKNDGGIGGELLDFLSENMYALDAILEVYSGMTDDADERELLDKFKNLLASYREDVREKARNTV